jgi:hypothetical protein
MRSGTFRARTEFTDSVDNSSFNTNNKINVLAPNIKLDFEIN